MFMVPVLVGCVVKSFGYWHVKCSLLNIGFVFLVKIFIHENRNSSIKTMVRVNSINVSD